jgi:acyl-CoA thioester hydrolase
MPCVAPGPSGREPGAIIWVMKPPVVPIEKVTALEPVCLRLTIPESYRDENGHMNMRWYLAIFDDAGEVLHERLGLTPAYHRAHRTGTVDLEHHVHYLAEVMPLDQVAVYVRCVAWSPKRLHYLMFMVNESRGRLASVFECINAFLDAAQRKTAPFPPEIAQRIAAAVAGASSLNWPPPLCGAMRP